MSLYTVEGKEDFHLMVDHTSKDVAMHCLHVYMRKVDLLGSTPRAHEKKQ